MVIETVVRINQIQNEVRKKIPGVHSLRRGKKVQDYYSFWQKCYNITVSIIIIVELLIIYRGRSHFRHQKNPRTGNQDSRQNYEQFQLIGGNLTSEGNVFALNVETGIFGPICDDSWNLQAASLVCKNLGYFDAITFTQDSFFGQVSGQFSYCNVKCSGFESQLFECSHSDVNDCTSLEGAGVKCEVGNSKLSQSFLSPFPNQTKGSNSNVQSSSTTSSPSRITPSNPFLPFLNQSIIVGFPLIKGPQVAFYNEGRK